MKKLTLILVVLLVVFSGYAFGFTFSSSMGVTECLNLYTKTNSKTLIMPDTRYVQDFCLGVDIGKFEICADVEAGAVISQKSVGFSAQRPYLWGAIGAGISYDINELFKVGLTGNLGKGSYSANGHVFNIIGVKVFGEMVLLKDRLGALLIQVPVSYKRTMYSDSLALGICLGYSFNTARRAK